MFGRLATLKRELYSVVSCRGIQRRHVFATFTQRWRRNYRCCGSIYCGNALDCRGPEERLDLLEHEVWRSQPLSCASRFQ